MVDVVYVCLIVSVYLQVFGDVVCCIEESKVLIFFVFFFSIRRRHTSFLPVSWARRCVYESGFNRFWLGISRGARLGLRFLLYVGVSGASLALSLIYL